MMMHLQTSVSRIQCILVQCSALQAYPKYNCDDDTTVNRMDRIYLSVWFFSCCWSMLLSCSQANYNGLTNGILNISFLLLCVSLFYTGSIYLAPSSLKGHPGLGLFTTRNIDEGETIMPRRDGISIPVTDTYNGNEDKVNGLHEFHQLHGEYWWARGVPDHVAYEAKDIMDFQLAFGSLPNHHCLLDSLDPVYPAPFYNDQILNRFHDPGAGAISYDMGRAFLASRDIKANEELFMSYGYCHRDSETGKQHDWVDEIPMLEDYNDAAQIIWKHWGSSGHDLDAPIPKPTKNVNKHVLRLIPDTVRALAPDFGKMAFNAADVVELLARNIAATPRTTDWIVENGMCMENLLPVQSEVKDAGEGAVAQFALHKGEIIAPVMLLHIMNHDALSEFDYYSQEVVRTQLLMNYCMGHAESTVLLCPHTNAVMVNHCSTRAKDSPCKDKGPNAKYQWSTGWDPTSDLWRSTNKTLGELGSEYRRVLSMELVALRDIEPGEEVYVDYGTEWEEAWEKHVAEWVPPPSLPPQEGTWITAKEANDNAESVLEEFISGDLRKKVNRPHLFTGCYYYASKHDKDKIYRKPNQKWKSMSDEYILDSYSDDGSEYVTDYTSHSDHSYWPCSVLYEEEKENGDSSNSATYTVRIHQSHWDRTLPWAENGVPRILTNYPRDSIHFFVRPYESDQHLERAFRYPMAIPDDIFPEHWKNKNQQAEKA